MKNQSILEHLNPAQLQVVTAPVDQNILVNAGAGSGKTRVLVHRIAWLIAEQNISPYGILAVTFTNKAASEMRSRIEAMVGHQARSIWMGTFHGIAHRLLRMHWQDAGLSENFQILDSDDQLRLIKRIIRNLGFDEKKLSPKEVQWYINQQKDEGLRAKNIPVYNQIDRKMKEVYMAYEKACQQGHLVDFAEILLRSYELLNEKDDLREHYHQRFKCILVDEFQDTNAIQYAWVRLLAGPNANIMIVGDDDQSIYGWRGAKVENIQQFKEHYTNTQVIRLEQNYRSTATILDAANSLIAQNTGRLGKNLWTDGDPGEPIYLYNASNEIDEARFVVAQIQKLLATGNYAKRDFAILYRSNVQSRILEEVLIQNSMDYHIYGGMRFFERAEIKDHLGYLRLISNRNDDPAFERVVNTPPRGIGARTVEIVRETAQANDISLWQASLRLIQEQGLSARAATALGNFINLIDEIAAQSEKQTLDEKAQLALDKSGLLAHYEKDKNIKALAKVENLKELITACKQFAEELEDSENHLVDFLSHAVLEAGEHQQQRHEDAIQMMTLHSAKGLEFPVVFLCGMDNGLFPHYMSFDDPSRLEEERRLCYVGMTRAREKLYFSCAERRQIQGREQYYQPSTFVKEIDQNFLKKIRSSRVHQPISRSTPSFSNTTELQNAKGKYSLGQLVCHPKFGEGTILKIEQTSHDARLQIAFADDGVKWIMGSFCETV